MIRSHDNQKLKTIRKLQSKRWRSELGLFAAEGEDLVAAGWEPLFVLRAGEDVEPALLEEASTLGSGTRVIGVYEQRWVEPSGQLSVYLHGVSDPGNVGTIIRSAHALADGPVILGPGCADPYSPKAVRASMGSIFARPPARADFDALPEEHVCIALHRGARDSIADVAASLLEGVSVSVPLVLQPAADGDAREVPEPDRVRPVTLCLGAEREGLPAELAGRMHVTASISTNADGPDSLNVAMAASIALYEVANRMAAHG